jgi:YHS domain-containing protein
VITRIILLTFIAFLIVRMLRMFLRAAAIGAPRDPAPPASAVKLVRDPVCGTHLSPKGALTLSRGGTTHYFCSEECRVTFRTRT